MEIVKLQLSEWQTYKSLRLRALKEDPQAFGASYDDNAGYSEEEWKRRLNNALEAKTNWLLFARSKNKLVGMMAAFMEDKSGDMAKIYSVYVPKEERGKGIASALMEALLNELSAKPYLKKVQLEVNKDQLAALSLYKKFGFNEVGSEPHVMGDGTKTIELIMERLLKDD